MTSIQKIANRMFTAVRPYITVYFLIGLGISLLCLWVFAEIADEINEQESLVAIDNALAETLYASAYAQRTQIFIFISLLGSQYFLPIVIGIAVLWYAWKRQWKICVLLLITVAGGMFLNLLLKEWFVRPRPQFDIPLAIEQSFSFPSGHSMLSLIVYGMLGYLICIQTTNRYVHILTVFCVTMLVLLIGISRMYLGVHYLTDVLAGFTAGGVWLGTCILVAETLHRHQELNSTT